MAIFHLHIGVIKRSSGYSSVAAAAYHSANTFTDRRTGIIHDYTRKRGVVHSEIILPEGTLPWMQDREQLWNAAELIERRRDAQPARVIDVSLPVELTQTQNVALVRAFVQTNFVTDGMVADFSLHHDHAHNPHAHILLPMRRVDNQAALGFSRTKERAWNNTELLVRWRASWAVHVNQHLETYGHQERIDHRSNIERGIPTIPTIYLGRAYHALKYRGRAFDRVQENRNIIEMNQAIEGIDTRTYIENVGFFAADVELPVIIRNPSDDDYNSLDF